MILPAPARGRRQAARGAAALALVLVCAARLALAAAPPVPEKPARYVTDRAGVLDPGRAEQLNSRLEQFEKDTSIQMLVWIDRHVPENTTIEEFAVNAMKAWGVGQAKLNNGLVLFAFVDDRKMRIEVGYGLEGSIPDAIASRIREDEITPRFKSGDYTGGVEAGMTALMAAARGEYKGTGSTVDERRRGTTTRGVGGIPFGCLWPFLFFFVLPWLLRPRHRTFGRRGWRSGGWGGWG
ncbi:MAG: TPM domain-containing protein, partial [Acidobacteria bacterium]|nr:TPM domain-containing protein [Acidobacteriota bacterium]MCA1611990.1 TPM domain-containing protein [Acidobacteriota bacterium]